MQIQIGFNSITLEGRGEEVSFAIGDKISILGSGVIFRACLPVYTSALVVEAYDTQCLFLEGTGCFCNPSGSRKLPIRASIGIAEST